MHGRRVVTSLLLLPIILACIFWRHGIWMSLAYVSVYFVLARAELYNLMGVRHKVSLMVWQGLLAFSLFAFLVLQQYDAALGMAFLFYFGSCVITFNYPLQGCRHEVNTHGFALVYLLAPLACYLYLRNEPSGSSYLFFALSVAIFTDIGAFYGGQLFGRHKMAPAISPKKTWEGAVAGTLVSCLVIGIVAVYQANRFGYALWFSEPNRMLHLFLITVVMSVVGQLGDLFESGLKRDAGIKDSGSSLTGHGGLLDMGDAILALGPAMLVYVKLFIHA